MSIILWIFQFAILVFFFLIFLPFFKKYFNENIVKYTNNFEKRIHDLNEWIDVWKKSSEYDSKAKEFIKFSWALEKIMVLDYSIYKNKKVIPTIEKYKLLNKKQNSDI